MAVRSKNFSKNHEFDFVCPFLHIKMPFIASNHTYYQRRYIPLHIETDFSPLTARRISPTQRERLQNVYVGGLF